MQIKTGNASCIFKIVFHSFCFRKIILLFVYFFYSRYEQTCEILTQIHCISKKHSLSERLVDVTKRKRQFHLNSQKHFRMQMINQRQHYLVPTKRSLQYKRNRIHNHILFRNPLIQHT